MQILGYRQIAQYFVYWHGFHIAFNPFIIGIGISHTTGWAREEDCIIVG